VVIFDEASQITTWDAIGAIARARQTIIVGDPKQLPPTNFFGRNEDDDEDIADHEKDLESILDEAKAAGIPVRDLRWHYRSRSESLIAFSNHHYYQNRLVTFPSPAVEDRAVHLRKVPHGVYDRGKSRTNKIEAEAVVKEAVARMKAWLKLPEKERPTLGVITFNAQQQSLILDRLDAARRDDPELEWFFAEERVEPAIVKNLENVQGDERDVMLFSITFWKDAAGKLTMDFGALNRDGGERRLNVAVTRARQELIVFSGFTADQIDPSRTKALAVQHLKTFLDYAERGVIALPAQDIGSVGSFDSPFEEAVAGQLEQRGWMIVPQVGISGFRIDLGIRHPDLAGAYLAGVECDGATYHESATARDRDKVREQVLRGLGWNILRVWSTDWWFDAAGCAERLHAGLESLLDESRARRRTGRDRDPLGYGTQCGGNRRDS
jgi:very-short-patch-repair endonuclease